MCYRSVIVPDIKLGIGSIQKISNYIEKLHGRKVVLVVDPILETLGVIEKVIRLIEKEKIFVDVINQVEPDPSFYLLEKIATSLKDTYDVYIGIGGGSILDLTKMLAVLETNPLRPKSFIGTNKVTHSGKPTIMIPTISGSGKEVTSSCEFFDESSYERKEIVSDLLLPNIAIIDPNLTITCSPIITAASGLHALSHALESYVQKKSTAMVGSFAISAIKIISQSLFRAVFNGRDIEARKNMAIGSLLAGIACNQLHVSLIHALSNPIEARLKISHGVASATILPFVMEYYFTFCEVNLNKIARVLDIEVQGLVTEEIKSHIISYIKNVITGLGFPISLSPFGMTMFDIRPMAEEAKAWIGDSSDIHLKEIKKIYKNAYTEYHSVTTNHFVKEEK